MTPDHQATADLASIRRSARYHLACMFIERLYLHSTRRVKLRHCTQPVYEVGTWLNLGLGLDAPQDQIDNMTMAVALSDNGFDLRLTARGDLLTNFSATAMHRYSRELREADCPRVAPTWEPIFPAFDMRWPDRLARLDAEIAAKALH